MCGSGIGDGVLDMRAEPLAAACADGDTAKWVDSHHVCVLLTHLPVTWLVDGGAPFVNDVCDGPGRFAPHLFGHVKVKNIAFDMQHTFPCLQAVGDHGWPQGMDGCTVFLDHRQQQMAKALRKDKEIRLRTTKDNEGRLLVLLRDRATDFTARKIKLAARAYTVLPPMHGFLINDRVLITGVCRVENAHIRTTPYRVFLLEGEDSNIDPALSKEMIGMFSSWFDEHWTRGRALRLPVTPRTTRARS
jgi:hypothetical protein